MDTIFEFRVMNLRTGMRETHEGIPQLGNLTDAHKLVQKHRGFAIDLYLDGHRMASRWFRYGCVHGVEREAVGSEFLDFQAPMDEAGR